MTHELKILPEYYEAVRDGKKNFELRKDDRGFEVGDFLVLKEWDGESFTGRELLVCIQYILRDCPQFGLMEGYCLLSI